MGQYLVAEALSRGISISRVISDRTTTSAHTSVCMTGVRSVGGILINSLRVEVLLTIGSAVVGFARQHDCKRHMLLHEGLRPFECEGCGKKFARLDALT